MTIPSPAGIHSLEVGISLFRTLHRLGHAASLTELSEAAQMHPSKAHRYLVSLVRTGLVAHDGRGQYRLGPLAAQLAQSACSPSMAIEVASQGLNDLALEIAQTVFLSIWVVGGPQVIKLAESNNPVSLRPSSRGELPLWNSATSRIFMAYMPQARVEQLLDAESERDRQQGLGTTALRERRKVCLDQIELARRHGVARTTGERQPGLASFAAPIFDTAGQVVLAVTVIGIEAALGSSWRGKAPRSLKNYAARVMQDIAGHAPT